MELLQLSKIAIFHTSFYIYVPELSLVASRQFVKD